MVTIGASFRRELDQIHFINSAAFFLPAETLRDICISPSRPKEEKNVGPDGTTPSRVCLAAADVRWLVQTHRTGQRNWQ